MLLLIPTYRSADSLPYQELPGLPEARVTGSKKNGDDDDIPPATYKFRLYSGKILQLYASNLFRLDDKFCRGLFTGDDFCDVSGVVAL